MAEPTMREILVRLEAQETELARLRRARHRRRGGPRRWATPLVALLVALVPLAVLAANPFTDLVPGSPHNANIDAIYNAGVTTGCVPDQEYCPTRNVTREEMASFLARLGGLGGNKPVANAARLATTNPTASGPTYAANELVRAARTEKSSFTPAALTAADQTAVTLAISAPAAGFVVVTAELQTQATNAGCPCEIRFFLVPDDGTPQSNYTVYNHQATGFASGTTTFVVPVAGGNRSIALVAHRQTGTATVEFDYVTMSALYVPFGSTGAGTLGAGGGSASDGPTSTR